MSIEYSNGARDAISAALAQNQAAIAKPDTAQAAAAKMSAPNVSNAQQGQATGMSPGGGAPAAAAGAPSVPEQQGGSLFRITDHSGSASGGPIKPGMSSSLSSLIGGGGGTDGAAAAGGAATAQSGSDATAKADNTGKSAQDQTNAQASAMASSGITLKQGQMVMANADQAQQSAVSRLQQG